MNTRWKMGCTAFLVLTVLMPTVSFADNSVPSAEEQAQQIAAELNYDETKIIAKIEELKAMLAEMQAKVKEAQKTSSGGSGGSVSLPVTTVKVVAPTLTVSAKPGMMVNVFDPEQKEMADATKDGVVDNADLSLVFKTGLGTVCEGCLADVNKDGVVSVQDVMMISLFWTGLYK